MPASATTYPDWKAPAEDGQTLIWPETGEILRQVRENHRRLSTADVRVANIPLAEIRGRMRAWIGHANEDQAIVASAHQAELYHPGVWVKDLLANAVAAKVGAAAFHFAVDTDAPKHLVLRWPGGAEPITDD